jgi:PEP-CTERM motif
MKKISLLLGLALTFIALPGVLAYADASKEGCEHSGGKAAGCSDDTVSAPEPSSLALLTLGLAATGGVALVLRRRREAQN